MQLFNKEFNLENLYLKQDPASGLIAIIAIHNTQMGPALGGCRFVSYPSVDAAITDAIQLATAMTYKSTVAGLPLGGGKAVLIAHPGISHRKKIFELFGEMVEELKGKYITASDSGTNEEDMRIVATKTTFVTSINKTDDPFNDTAYMTALGVLNAIQSAVQFKLNKKELDNIHIAIQGMGSVGFLLAKMLLEKGAKITACDVNTALLNERRKQLPFTIIPPQDIYQVACDVFSPCALGGIINPQTLASLKASIICGAANNQLSNDALDQKLCDQDIAYVPDYVANAGGVICAAAQAGVITQEMSCQKVSAIADSVSQILSHSASLHLPTTLLANQLAEKKWQAAT
jgi:leucine dehydrogenase